MFRTVSNLILPLGVRSISLEHRHIGLQPLQKKKTCSIQPRSKRLEAGDVFLLLLEVVYCLKFWNIYHSFLFRITFHSVQNSCFLLYLCILFHKSANGIQNHCWSSLKSTIAIKFKIHYLVLCNSKYFCNQASSLLSIEEYNLLLACK